VLPAEDGPSKAFMRVGTASYRRWRPKRADQHITDDLVDNQTEAMRRRYRHLYPQTAADAVRQVFG